MVLEKLGNSLKETLRKVAKGLFVDEKLVNELVKDLQRALLSADVDVKLVFELTNSIKKRILKDKIPESISKREYLVKVVYEELVKFLGGEKEEIKIVKKKPFKIMMVGVFGSGKSTSIAKIANYYKKRGYKIATLGLDVHRPAAFDQLEQLSKQVNVDCFLDRKEKNPLKIYKKFENEFKKYDILIIDTAGRDSLDKNLINEIKSLNKEINPDENILVISADIGQASQKLAQGFKDACGVTSVLVSKLDGTAKGGGALTGASVTGAKIKFIGTGEKIDDLEIFNPKGFVGRLLGMGDLEALLEKAKEAVDEEEVKDLGKKFLKGEFNLIDLYEQMRAMKKMGPLNKVLEMVPGFGQLKLPKDVLQVQEGKLEHWREAMNSMTRKELENPELVLEGNRLQRISKGSGVPISDIRMLIKQYRQSKKLMRMMKGQDPEKMMKKFKGKLPFKI
ncbi:MAG: signal recognition particle protein [Nanoarchaeota archaeon]|nr:signal recognition particle protein [Nanoarchaeota archaeon]